MNAPFAWSSPVVCGLCGEPCEPHSGTTTLYDGWVWLHHEDDGDTCYTAWTVGGERP